MYERKTPNVNTHRITTTSTTKQPSPIKRNSRQCTGRASLASATNQQQFTDEQKEIQRRIAMRAATAMSQIRRRQPRSYMIWGDNRRAVIKRYPDGAQEIMVPQTLTPEQEQYEFPPRSRLLKKLATSTAERHRLSSLQYNIATAPALPQPQPSPSSNQSGSIVTNPHAAPDMELDQVALADWFSGKHQQYRQQKHSQTQHTAKEKAVMDWMSDVERSASLAETVDGATIKNHLSANARKLSSTKQATQNMHDINIHFRSKAGKLLASGLYRPKSYNYLSPPNEDTKKDYVSLRRLTEHSNRPWKTKAAGTINTLNKPHTSVSSSLNHQQLKNDPSSIAATAPVPFDRHCVQAPRPAVSSAAPPTSKSSGMVRLAQMFHKTLQDQQARAHERMQQLESILEEERYKRQNIQLTQQRTMSELDTFMKQYEEERRIPPSPILSITSSSSPSPSVSPAWASIISPRSSSSNRKDQQNLVGWMERITELENRMQDETKSRQALQHTMATTIQRMDRLEKSLSTRALEHSVSQLRLETQVNETFSKLSILAQRRKYE
ncbi:hypothetical protein BCR42DRAFT_487995 [Absidia repens]|uniref:Uncharacterized protein n=1 Tax=Absidia repens TaxID=90262 RepID=A0A1X2IUJ7_9FUNG|nr:hypothetical protein BCR42DRAFT_487995 [Absidia repens]